MITSANITYIDAVEGADGNTFATGGSPDDVSWADLVSNKVSADAQKWVKRTTFGNGGGIFQGWQGSPTLPELTTKISGLADGSYDVWVFFWDQPSPQNWNISAGLISGELTTYGTPGGPGDTTSAVTAATLTFTNDAPTVMVAEGIRTLYGVKLGQATVSDGSDINVFINNQGGGFVLRTWYDGVGYAPATVPTEESFAITSFTAIGGDIWEAVIEGAPGTTYQFRSAPDLDFEAGVPVEGLTQGDPDDAGTVGSGTNSRLTTDAQGIGVARMTLTGSSNFVRAETLPPILSVDFEADGAGFTTTGAPNDWAWGLPASNNGFNLVLESANNESTGCWGTNLGEGGPLSGVVNPAAESILRSPDIDLTGIAGAQLEFAAAYDLNTGDTIEVRIREAGTDALLGTILPLTPPVAPVTSGWTDLGPFDLSIADDSIIYLEFFYKGTDDRFIGWYIDDVLIRE